MCGFLTGFCYFLEIAEFCRLGLHCPLHDLSSPGQSSGGFTQWRSRQQSVISACGHSTFCFLAVWQSLVSFLACAFATKQVKVSRWIMNHDFPEDVLQGYCTVRMWSCFCSPCRICTSSTTSPWFHHCQASMICKLCWKAIPFCMKSLQPSINYQNEKKFGERKWWLKHSISVNRWLRWVDNRCYWQ